VQNKSFRTGPVAMANAAANILNGAVTALTGPVGITLTQPVLTVKKVTIVNKTAGSVNASLFIGATGGSAAGTEFLVSAYPVPANSYIERYCNTRLESTDFLSGLASAATSLTIEIEGEVGFQ
jgi:hypothetical protein